MEKQTRLVVHIDPERCNGCGECVPSCAEGAIQIIDGKARLVADNLCDGLGACLGHCPMDAIRLEEREADAFDETAVEQHLTGSRADRATPVRQGCPGLAASMSAPRPSRESESNEASDSGLGNWPVQLHLLNPGAPYLAGASLLVAADCVAFAYPDFHRQLPRGRVTAIGCPKLDDAGAYIDKLAEILRRNQIKDITLAVMEVPCCGGLRRIVELAQAAAGTEVPVHTVTITLDGRKMA